MTTNKTPLSHFEAEERRARNRLAVYRAKLHRAEHPSAMASERRLHELERMWHGAAQRLRRAKEN